MQQYPAAHQTFKWLTTPLSPPVSHMPSWMQKGMCGLHRLNFYTAQLAPFCIIYSKVGEVSVNKPEIICILLKLCMQWTLSFPLVVISLFPGARKNVGFIDIWLLASTYYTCSHEPQLLQGQHLSCLSSNLSSENEILRFKKPLWLNPIPFDFKNIENSTLLFYRSVENYCGMKSCQSQCK